jgi:GTPase SAR1 family protein
MGEHKKLKIIKGEIEMNQNFMTLNGSQATKLINFLKKINYPKEELITVLNKELVEFDKLIEFENNLPLAIQKVNMNWLLTQISSTIFKNYEKSISKGQAKALIKRILGIKLANTERTQLSELRKKIRRYEKFLTYFGAWGKEPDQVFKVLIIGLDDEQSNKLSNVLLRPKVSGNRDTLGVDFYIKTLESYDKSLTTLHFWNISGDKRYEFLRELYYKGASAIILIYEKGNKDSLLLTKKYYEEFKKATSLKFKLKKIKNIQIATPVVLVGLGAKPIMPSQGGPHLAIELGARYFDKTEITSEEFDDVFNLVSLELLVKCQNQLL